MDDDLSRRIKALSDYQREILVTLADGRSSKEAARLLRRTPGAIDQQVHKAVKDLGLSNRREAMRAVSEWVRYGTLPARDDASGGKENLTLRSSGVGDSALDAQIVHERATSGVQNTTAEAQKVERTGPNWASSEFGGRPKTRPSLSDGLKWLWNHISVPVKRLALDLFYIQVFSFLTVIAAYCCQLLIQLVEILRLDGEVAESFRFVERTLPKIDSAAVIAASSLLTLRFVWLVWNEHK